MGAIAVGMSVSGNQIVSGANTVTHINGASIAGGLGNTTTGNQFLSRADSNTTDSVTGVLGSVRGTLVRTATGGPPSTTETYTFTPAAGQILPAKLPPGSPFLADNPNRRLTHVIWSGTNDIGFGDADARITPMVQAMIDSLGHNRWVILPPLNRTGQADFQEGGVWWTEVFTIESRLANIAKSNFVNIRRMLIDQGLTRAAISATGTDTADIAADTVPTSLKADFIHQNAAGNAVVAEIVAEQLLERGI